jgi:hypothetical protein
VKNIKTIILLFILLRPCLSDDKPSNLYVPYSRHGIYAELGGPGFYTSLNYEYHFKSNLGFRAGVGVSPLEFSYPLFLNYCRGQEKSLETGLGLLHLRTNWAHTGDYGYIKRVTGDGLVTNYIVSGLGYRYRKYPEGLIFRGTVYPAYGMETKEFYFLIGLSLGHSF